MSFNPDIIGIPLRKNVTAWLDLPKDMTPKEAAKIAARLSQLTVN